MFFEVSSEMGDFTLGKLTIHLPLVPCCISFGYDVS